MNLAHRPSLRDNPGTKARRRRGRPAQYRWAVALTVGASLLLSSCGSEPEKPAAKPVKTVPLQLDFIYSNGFEALAYGHDQGFFTEEGIDLKVISGRGSNLALQQLGTGKTEFAMSSLATYIQSRLRGEVDAMAIFAYINVPPICIAAHTPIDKPEQMIGKSFGTIAQSAGKTTVPYVLKQNGIAAKDVDIKIFDVSLLLTQLLNNKIDTAESHTIGSWIRDQATARKAGKELHCTPMSNWGYKDYGRVLLVNKATLTKDPDLVKGMVTALHKSWTKAATASVDDVYAAMKKANPQAAREDVEASWAGQLDLVKNPGPLAEDVVAYSLKFSQDSLGVTTEIPVADLYDNSFIPKP